MSKWIGRRESIGIGAESTRGVGVAATYWLNVLSFSFADQPTKARSEAGFGGIWGGDQAPMVYQHAEGDMEVELGDSSFGVILKALLGTVSTANNGDSTYTHTYTLQNDNAHDSLSIHTVDPIGNLIFELSMIDSLVLNITPENIISYTVTFKSKSSQASAGETVTYTSENKFLGRHLTFKVAATTADLTAASKVNLKSLSLTFEKNAEIETVLSTSQPEDIVNKMFNIKGEITLNYEDRTWLNYVKDGTYRAIRIQLTNTDETIGSGSQNPDFKIDLSKCDFDAWDPDFAMDDLARQTLTFQALYDAGGNDNLINSCTLINTVVSY